MKFLSKINYQTKQKKQKVLKKINVIACKICHATNITLIKGPDSYYCKFCYDKLIKKGNK